MHPELSALMSRIEDLLIKKTAGEIDGAIITIDDYEVLNNYGLVVSAEKGG